MSLKKKLEEEVEERGEGKRMKLNFTSQKPSKKGGLHKDNKTKERPQRKSQRPKTER